MYIEREMMHDLLCNGGMFSDLF